MNAHGSKSLHPLYKVLRRDIVVERYTVDIEDCRLFLDGAKSKNKRTLMRVICLICAANEAHCFNFRCR
jgi:hypothetical protein